MGQNMAKIGAITSSGLILAQMPISLIISLFIIEIDRNFALL